MYTFQQILAYANLTRLYWLEVQAVNTDWRKFYAITKLLCNFERMFDPNGEDELLSAIRAEADKYYRINH